jgi:branched-chain amino acid transport system substrate-binding protein
MAKGGRIMKRIETKSVLGLGLFVVIASIFTLGLIYNAGAADTRGVTPTEIRIGCIPDFTGPAAHGARKSVWGIRNYFNDVNEQGGIHGRKINFFVEDGKYNPSVALNAFKKLVLKDEVFAMTFNLGSGMVKAQLPLIEQYRVPLVGPGVQSSWISEPPKKYIFSTMVSMGYCSRVLIDYVVNDLGDKKPRIGVLYMHTEMGQEALREIKDHAAMYGFQIVAETSYSPRDIDVAGQVAKLKSANVDYVFVCAISRGAPYAIREAAKLDWKPQFLIPGNGSSEHIFRLGREAMFYGKPPLGASEYLPISADSKAKKLCQKWVKKYEYKDKLDTKSLYGPSYASVVVEGLKRAGKDLTVEGYLKALETIKNFDNLAQAPVTFGPNIRQGVKGVVLYRGVPGPGGVGRWGIEKLWVEPKKP